MARQTTPEARRAKVEERHAERAARKRVHQYPLRLNAAERTALETAAAARGTTPANLLRAAFLSPAGGSPAARAGVPPTGGLEPAALAQLTRIGSNLNQLARRVNAGDALQPGELPEALDDLKGTLARIEALVFAHIDD